MAKKKTFDGALNELEKIVKNMESGELPLEEAVKQYELGIKQSKFCMDLLDKTEKKISLLTKDENGSVKKVPFDKD